MCSIEIFSKGHTISLGIEKFSLQIVATALFIFAELNKHHHYAVQDRILKKLLKFHASKNFSKKVLNPHK